MPRFPWGKVASLAVGVLLAGSAQAFPGLDAEIGARYWSAESSGDIASGGRDISTDGDLGFDREGNPSLYARLGLPLVTLDAEYTRLDYSGRTRGRTFQFSGQTFSTSGRRTDFEAEILHGGAMLNLPLPVLDVGLGLGATRFDGEARVGSQRESGEITIPVAKGEVRVTFPGLPVNASVRGQGLGYDGDSFYDITAEIGVVWGPLQLRGGYRHLAVDFDDNSFKGDVTFKGPFAGLTLAL